MKRAQTTPLHRAIRWITRIAIFVSLFFCLLVLRELHAWYVFFNGLATWAGYVYLATALLVTCYFIVFPVARIFFLPSFGYPETSTNPNVQRRALQRRARLLGMGRMKAAGSTTDELTAFIRAEVDLRRPIVAEIRRRYVVTAFVGSAVSQNTVVDLFVVLSAAIRVVWKTLEAYGGRVPVKDTARVFRDVVVSGALGASEAAEMSSDAIIQLCFKSASKIPLLNVVTESLADGLVSGYLICRLAMVTENYCGEALTETKEHWRPSMKATSQVFWDILRASEEIPMKLGKSLGTAFHAMTSLVNIREWFDRRHSSPDILA